MSLTLRDRELLEGDSGGRSSPSQAYLDAYNQSEYGQRGGAAAAGAAFLQRKPVAHSVFANRRGLLLTAEQLAGPVAPAYLLRGAYVYGRQNLL